VDLYGLEIRDLYNLDVDNLDVDKSIYGYDF